MVKEVRQYTVKGMFAVEPMRQQLRGDAEQVVDTTTTELVAVRLTTAESSVWGPMGQQDELTVIVPQDQASRWAFGKSFTMTITED